MHSFNTYVITLAMQYMNQSQMMSLLIFAMWSNSIYLSLFTDSYSIFLISKAHLLCLVVANLTQFFQSMCRHGVEMSSCNSWQLAAQTQTDVLHLHEGFLFRNTRGLWANISQSHNRLSLTWHTHTQSVWTSRQIWKSSRTDICEEEWHSVV